ncbi:MAG: NAD(P)-dependent oxidoreductase [Nanoarchaeota archaeon]
MKVVIRIFPPPRWKKNYLENYIKKHKLPCMVFPSQAKFKAELKDTDVLVSNKLTTSELKLAKNLKFLMIPTSGTENIVLHEALSKNIKIIQNKDVMAKAVARYALDNLRKISNNKLGLFLKDKVVGILGFGHLGKFLFNALLPHGCKFLIIKKTNINGTNKKYSLDFVGGLNKINYVIKNSDIIINTLPLSKETKGLLKNKTSLLKEGAVILNLSRKGILSEKRILEKVKKGILGGAILDVYSRSIDESRYKQKNIIMTPHIAGIYGNGIIKIAKFITKEIKKLDTH